MDMIQAMAARHSVRAYVDKPLTEDVRAMLLERVLRLNQRLGLNMRLMCENGDAFSGLLGKLSAKGVRNYVVLAGPEAPDLAERIGWAGADIALYAQTIGLNSLWVAGTFSRKNTLRVADLPSGSHLMSVLAIGYGADQGVPHKSKSASELSSYAGEAPAWFTKGVEAALLAPTGMNRQAFKLVGEGTAVRLEGGAGKLGSIDRGIVKRFFELGAGVENFTWK